MENAHNDAIVVENNRGASRLEAKVGGQVAVAEYSVGPGTITFTHTLVPAELSGRGIATRMIEAGLMMARERRLQVIPRCGFVSAYMRKHPDVQDLLAPEGRKMLGV